MCGFVGVVASEPIESRAWLRAGRDAMRHRGPDAEGEWWSSDGRVGLGHRRLAIVDISPMGNQPMTDPSRQLNLVFNGEIYNFRELRIQLAARGHSFRTDSDTEVILAAYHEWDTDCLSRLDGMFAFAIYDERKRRIFLARDRAGEKPLFYSFSRGALCFSSELKGLLADPTMSRRIDRESLDCYLTMGYVPGDRCILQGVRKLPPAHALVFAQGGVDLTTWKYWSLPSNALLSSGLTDEAALLEELEAVLAAAVRAQLRADVPVGVLLSGGVDSSLITALAVREAPCVRTFTISFPGHEGFDECKEARLIADCFGTTHLELEAHESTVSLLPRLARQVDEPIADSSLIPTFLASQLVRQHCTVALGGDGGDELFGGYHHYNRLLWLNERAGALPDLLRSRMAAAASLLPIGFKGRNWMQGLSVDLRDGLPLIGAHFDAAARQRLMTQYRPWIPCGERIREQSIPQTADLLQRATRMDFQSYLPEDILVKVDRASMLNSLEMRAPLLDRSVIEFAFNKVPSHLKASSSNRKILLKRLAGKLLPKKFDVNRKQGFSAPLASWLKTPAWQQYFSEVLLGANSDVFDRVAVQRLMDGQAKGRANGERLFSLVMFELWRHEYRVSL